MDNPSYERPYDKNHPVVCIGEKPYQILREVREPLPMLPGSDRKTDSEYVRNGTVNGIWLDIAEIEPNVITRQCLSRRIAEIGLLRKEPSAWETERNTVVAKVSRSVH